MAESAASRRPDEPAATEANAANADGESNAVEKHAFSWLDPHPIFVIILVGSDETPFGIQKDFLCSKCRHYREYFHKGDGEQKTIEHVVRLSNTPVEVFAHVQHFLYTGSVFADPDQIPAYDVLVGIWKLGHDLGVEGLCERTLEAMSEYKRVTQSIPATPLLLQVWKDTPEGSSIRQLLLSWAAEYLRSSDDRSEFAKSLPKELLSELVVAMSSYSDYWAAAGARGGSNKRYAESDEEVVENGGDDHGQQSPASKRPRYFESYPVANGKGIAGRASSNPTTPTVAAASSPAVASVGRKPGRTSLPAARKYVKKRTQAPLDADAFSPSQKLKFCSDLLTRMLSGPGFWTRLVGPFREPVDPSSEGIPDYFEKVKRPMDLGTIKANLDNGRYTSQEEFAADMRQIFTNVYIYWKKGDPIWDVCKRLEKTFEEKYGQMNKWLGKMDGEEP